VEISTPSGIPIRLHRPSAAEGLPLLVYLHGGGWTTGSAKEIDALCTALADGAQCAVAAVEYRLAPEHPFPAGLDDCFAATAWLATHGSQLAIGGSSAGGNLAAAVALLARDRGGPSLVFQLLVYPPVDHRASADAERARFRRADIEWHWSEYLPDRSDGDDPRASPLRATDLSGLPPALVITAEHDPLTEEATAYARRLVEAGVPAEIRHLAGAQHGFFASDTPQGEAARVEAVAALRRAFGRQADTNVCAG
jgi:acetyl esterase